LFKPRDADSFFSEPDVITFLRLILSLSFFVLAIQKMNPIYNYIGLGIHWLGDVSDGFYARRFKQETIFGAEIDIIADRIETMFFYVIFLFFRPYLFLPVSIYIIDFAFVDFYLSYQFLKYDIISPNYFYRVDPMVYKLNFSPVGKFCNSTVVTLILIFLPKLKILATILAIMLIAVKIYSIHLLNKKNLAGKNIHQQKKGE